MPIVWLVAMLISGYLAYESMQGLALNKEANLFGVVAATVTTICAVKLLDSLTSRPRS